MRSTTSAGVVFPFAGASADFYFAGNKYWDGAADTFGNIFTVARASSAYSYNSAGVFTSFSSDQARITDLGLLCENAATNVVQQNVNMTTGWTNTNNTIATGQTSPDPNNATACTVTDTAVSGTHICAAANFTYVLSTRYCQSIIAKAGTGSLVQLTFPTAAFSGTTRYANFNLSTGAITANGGGVTAGITAFGNGWYQCWISAVCTTGTAAAACDIIRINSSSATRVPTYTGAATTIFVWLAQTEVGAGPSSPIVNTTSASITRAADNITITGSAATTAVYAAKSAYSDTNTCNFATQNVVCNIGAALLQASSNTQMQTSNGTNTATVTIPASGTIASEVKTAYGFDGTNLTVWANSSILVSTAASWGATSGTITVGNDSGLTHSIGGFIKRLAFSANASNFNPSTDSGLIVANFPYVFDGNTPVFDAQFYDESGNPVNNFRINGVNVGSVNAFINYGGAAFLSAMDITGWWSPPYTIMVSGVAPSAYNASTVNVAMAIFGANSSTDSVVLRFASGAPGSQLTVKTNNSVLAQLGFTTDVLGGSWAASFTLATNNVNFTTRSRVPVSDASFNLPTVTTMYLGGSGTAGQEWNGQIYRVTIW